MGNGYEFDSFLVASNWESSRAYILKWLLTDATLVWC